MLYFKYFLIFLSQNSVHTFNVRRLLIMKMNKLFTVLLVGSLVTTLSLVIFAKEITASMASNQEIDIPEKRVIEGKVGTVITVGDLIFEIVENIPVNTEASTSVYPSLSLSGTEMSKPFNLTRDYKYAKVWINNTGSNPLVFNITKGSPTGTTVPGSEVTVAAKTKMSVYSTHTWSPDTYYANFTSGKANMSGTTSYTIASTIPELD